MVKKDERRRRAKKREEQRKGKEMRKGRGRRSGHIKDKKEASRILLVQLPGRLPWFRVTIWQRRHWKRICGISRGSL